MADTLRPTALRVKGTPSTSDRPLQWPHAPVPRDVLEPFRKASFRLRSMTQPHSADLGPAERTSPVLRASTRMYWSFRGRASVGRGCRLDGVGFAATASALERPRRLGTGSSWKESPRQVLGSPLSAIWRIDCSIPWGDLVVSDASIRPLLRRVPKRLRRLTARRRSEWQECISRVNHVVLDLAIASSRWVSHNLDTALRVLPSPEAPPE
jgi:hypothetical protein